MKNLKKLSGIALLGLAILASCKKEEVKTQSNQLELENLTQNSIPENDILKEGMSPDMVSYMEALPDYDLEEFHREIELLEAGKESSGDRSSDVWGIGPDYRVYEWNGASWDEPNPAARLKWVEVGSYGNGVWGVGSNNRVYKWNGSSWDEPNPSFGAYYITAFSSSMAISMGNQGYLYITYNGGVSWSRFTSITGVNWMSCGNTVTNMLWAVNSNFGVSYFDYSSGTWQAKTTPNTYTRRVSAMFSNGVYTIDYSNYKIYKSLNGTYFWQPNPAAGLYMISAGGDDLTAWGTGYANRVYKTTNGGGSWSEPNPAARLIHVSAN